MAESYENFDSFDYFQQEEIRKGRENNLNVEVYAKSEFPYNIMRQLRKGLENGCDLTPYIDYGVGVLYELRKATQSGVQLLRYVNEGYDSEQLGAIRHALEKGIDIDSYLNIAYHGACISEIAIGLEHNIDVTPYADVRYTWRKMKEIRLGIEQRLDISNYASYLYSYWQMREIRLGLQEGLDVNYYKSLMYTPKEMHKRRISLKNRKNSCTAFKEFTILSDYDYDICIGSDGMSAYFNWHCKRAIVNIEELVFILNKNGITYGIDYEAVEAIARQYESIGDDSLKEQNTLIAKGTEPVEGNDGYYELFFNSKTDRELKFNDDRTIDFDSISWFEPVVKNQILAVYHFATDAKDGKTVTGTSIPAKKGREKPVLTGTGFKLSDDGKTYVASKNGNVSLHNNELTVSDLVVLDSLQYSDKILNFNCDVYIKGNIAGPVTLNINGNLEVDGFVESADIKCKGDLFLKRGIHAASGKGNVSVKGCVISRFFEYVTLHADGNIYFGSSLNSNISSYGEIIGYGKKGGIIGGTSYSEKGYCLPNIGNMAGTSTTLFLGTNDNIRLKRLELEKEIIEVKDTIARLRTAYNNFCKKLTTSQRNASAAFVKLEDALYTKNKELVNVYKKVSDLEKRQERACNSRIVVEQYVYDNVRIQYMNKNIVAVPSEKVVILVKDGNIIMEKHYLEAT